MEQLCDQTGEESIILTASISDGTLCHLGSNRGKNFLDGREELKSEFLNHCLKGTCKRISTLSHISLSEMTYCISWLKYNEVGKKSLLFQKNFSISDRHTA